VETLKLIFIIIPSLLELIRLVEGLVSGAKKGEQKKAAVVEIIKVVITGAQRAGLLSKINVDGLVQAVDVLIDTIVKILNATGVFEHGGESRAEG